MITFTRNQTQDRDHKDPHTCLLFDIFGEGSILELGLSSVETNGFDFISSFLKQSHRSRAYNLKSDKLGMNSKSDCFQINFKNLKASSCVDWVANDATTGKVFTWHTFLKQPGCGGYGKCPSWIAASSPLVPWIYHQSCQWFYSKKLETIKICENLTGKETQPNVLLSASSASFGPHDGRLSKPNSACRSNCWEILKARLKRTQNELILKITMVNWPFELKNLQTHGHCTHKKTHNTNAITPALPLHFVMASEKCPNKQNAFETFDRSNLDTAICVYTNMHDSYGGSPKIHHLYLLIMLSIFWGHYV